LKYLRKFHGKLEEASKINGYPGQVVEHSDVEFGDSNCIGLVGIMQKNRRAAVKTLSPQPGMQSQSPRNLNSSPGPESYFLIPESESESCQKEDCFWIFVYLSQCCMMFVELNWTYTSNINCVCVILCTILEHAMTEMRFK